MGLCSYIIKKAFAYRPPLTKTNENIGKLKYWNREHHESRTVRTIYKSQKDEKTTQNLTGILLGRNNFAGGAKHKFPMVLACVKYTSYRQNILNICIKQKNFIHVYCIHYKSTHPNRHHLYIHTQTHSQVFFIFSFFSRFDDDSDDSSREKFLLTMFSFGPTYR